MRELGIEIAWGYLSAIFRRNPPQTPAFSAGDLNIQPITGAFLKSKFRTTNKQSSSDDQPSALRRKLLMGCAYLPASSLLATLAGCYEPDSSTTPASSSTFATETETATSAVADAPASAALKVPLPPYATTDTPPAPPAPPAAQQTTVDVTHVPQNIPAAPATQPDAAKPTTMNVGIYDLEYNSFTQVSARQTVPAGTAGAITSTDPNDATKKITYEGIKGYLKRALDDRFALVYRGMVTAFATHSPKDYDISFFTAPEFFWNVPWGDFLNEAELQVAADIYLDTVTANSRALIAKFPASQYGQIVLLPGTVAALKPTADAITPDGSYAVTSGVVYEAFNHLVCTHNLPMDDKQHPRPAYMIWPKRVVSWIDFIDEANGDNGKYNTVKLAPNPADPIINNSVESCQINDTLKIQIEFVTSSVAASFDSSGQLLSNSFQNDIVDGLPFGLDICLDYADASVQSDQYRIAQLDQRKFKLDFVLSAGMFLETSNYSDTPYIQYAIHNDGILYCSESSSEGKYPLYSSVMKLTYDADEGTVTGDLLAPVGATATTDIKNGIIAVDESGSYAAPKDADSSGIPNILDAMNTANVRVWALSVDITDTSSATDTIIANAKAARTATAVQAGSIQMVD